MFGITLCFAEAWAIQRAHVTGRGHDIYSCLACKASVERMVRDNFGWRTPWPSIRSLGPTCITNDLKKLAPLAFSLNQDLA